MTKKLILFITLCLILSSLTGCWSKKELDEIAIATGLGLDKTEDGYIFTVQIINPAEVAAETISSRTAVTTYTSEGRSLFEALRKLTDKAPRKVYLSHIRKVVFGEELAREGIGKTLDFLSRDHELRTDFHIAVARDMKASELLKILTPMEKIPANKMFFSLETSNEYWAPTLIVKIQELITTISQEGKQPVLNGVHYSGDLNKGSTLDNVEDVGAPTDVIIDSIGVFKGDKLVGWLNESQSKSYNYLAGDVNNTAEFFTCKEDGSITLEVMNASSKQQASVSGGTPSFTVEVVLEGNIADVECVIDLMKTETVQQLEKDFAEQLTEKLNSMVTVVQEDFQSDIFGFGELLHRTHNSYWQSVKKDWNTTFPEVEVTVHTTVHINRTGTISNPYQNPLED